MRDNASSGGSPAPRVSYFTHINHTDSRAEFGADAAKAVPWPRHSQYIVYGTLHLVVYMN